jgi:tyrosine-specific transport protein
MVWIGRYHMNLGTASHFRVPGGKILLAIVFAFFLCTLGLEIKLQLDPAAELYEPFEAPIHNVKEVEAE